LASGFKYNGIKKLEFVGSSFILVKAKPAYQDEDLPSNRRDIEEDWDHFHLLLENILHRLEYTDIIFLFKN